MSGIVFFLKNLFRKSKIKEFKVGDKVRIGESEYHKHLIGLKGTVIDIDIQKKKLYIDFKKQIKREDFTTHTLNGRIKTRTGLTFSGKEWRGREHRQFSINNLTKI